MYYYITNLQGDVMQIVDSNGATVATYEYDPYGDNAGITGAFGYSNPIRYRGYYYDRETDFYYLQSRYYDPNIGRFLNADAYASTGQGIIGNNMFAYCNNSPVINADPAGCVSSRVIFPVCIDSGCKKLVTHANGNRGDELLQYVLNEFDMPSASGTVYVDVEYSGEHERTIYGDLGSIVTWTGFGCLVIGKASAKIAPFCPPLAPCLTMVAGVSI